MSSLLQISECVELYFEIWFFVKISSTFSAAIRVSTGGSLKSEISASGGVLVGVLVRCL